MDIKIRTVKPEDLDLVTAVEAECFPAAEAAGRADFERRIKTFPESFLIAEKAGRIIGFAILLMLLFLAMKILS